MLPRRKERNAHLVALGAEIRRHRLALGWSQEDLAERVGLDRSYIGSVERGERNIAALNLIAIAQALNVSIGTLFASIGRSS